MVEAVVDNSVLKQLLEKIEIASAGPNLAGGEVDTTSCLLDGDP